MNLLQHFFFKGGHERRKSLLTCMRVVLFPPSPQKIIAARSSPYGNEDGGCSGTDFLLPTQPATVVRKMAAQLEYAHVAYTFFARLTPICMLSRCLVTKFLPRSSGGSLLRVHRRLGSTPTTSPPRPPLPRALWPNMRLGVMPIQHPPAPPPSSPSSMHNACITAKRNKGE